MAHKVPELAALKGHGFSRADGVAGTNAALAAEGMQVARHTFPQGLKPKALFCSAMARLKPRPLKAAHEAARINTGFSIGRSFTLCRTVVCLALLLVGSLALPAQELTLYVDVKLVNVFVNVTDRNGAIVGGLTREDFAVTEDGRPQQIAVFERQSELPLNLTLAIDTSGSVRKDLSEEADAARRFVHAILRPQDQMSLLQFATDVKRTDPLHQQSCSDRSRPEPAPLRLGYCALRRHRSRF